MATTALEALQNAQINFRTVAHVARAHPIFAMAMEQLNNGIEALENGLDPHDEIQAHLGADVKTSRD